MKLEILLDILSYTRPSSSKNETYILDKYFGSIEGSYYDEFGNWWYSQGEGSKWLFTAHSDTVHDYYDVMKYELEVTDNKVRRKGGGILGADCGTGMFILLSMIEAGVPGTYVIYAEEEVGGFGSANSSEYNQDNYYGISYALSFDRRGTSDVITHMCGVRTCTDEFAEGLCDFLALGHKPSFEGVFTDSFNLREIVFECTNLSVGYFNAHTDDEYQDLAYLERLIHVLTTVDWQSFYYEDGNNSLLRMVIKQPYRAARLLRMHGVTQYDFEF